MLIRQVVTGFFLLVGNWGLAQSDTVESLTRMNSIFVEWRGNLVGDYSYSPVSLNYERCVYRSRFCKLLLRTGTDLPIAHNEFLKVCVPILLNIGFGKHRVFGEVGIGYEMYFLRIYETWHQGGAVTANLGVRVELFEERLLIRAGFTPTFGYLARYLYNGEFIGASLGYQL